MFDENCIDGYCEDADYKQRCYLNGVKIENLGKSGERNLGMSRRINKRIYDTITVNRIYIKEKWGKSISKDENYSSDGQPPYEFKHPFNKTNLDTKFIPMTDRMKKIQDLKDNKLLSQEEIFKLLIDPQGINKS